MCEFIVGWRKVGERLNKVLVLNEESRSEFIHQFECFTIKDHGFFNAKRDNVEFTGVMRKLEY